MTSPAFPLRFKDPSTKDMLRLVSDQLGVPMTEVAEGAIRHELILLGAGIERQLSEVVAALRNYNPDTDLDVFIADAAAGEALGDPLQATQIKPAAGRKRVAAQGKAKKAGGRNPQLAGALAAFKQG